MVAQRARSGVAHLGYTLTADLNAATGNLARGLEAIMDPADGASLTQNRAELVAGTALHVRRWLELITWQNRIDGPSEGVDRRIADVLASLFVEATRRSLDGERTARVVQGELIEQLHEQDRQTQIERQATYADELGKPFDRLTFADVRALEALASDAQSREERALRRTSAILQMVARHISNAALIPYRPAAASTSVVPGLPGFRRGLMKIGFEWDGELDEMSESVGAALDTGVFAATMTPADATRREHAMFALGRTLRESALILAAHVGHQAEPGTDLAERVARVFTALIGQAVERSSRPDLAHHAVRADLALNLMFDQGLVMTRVRNDALRAAVGGDDLTTRAEAYRAWSAPLHARHGDLVVYAHAAETLRALGRQLRPSCDDLLGKSAALPISGRS